MPDVRAWPSTRELFWAFFRAGARGFGGMLPWAHRMLVEEHGWLTAAEFIEVFSFCQVLPGPNIINVAVVVGSRFQGARGAVAAFAGLMAVPQAVVIALGLLYARFGQAPGIDALLRGVGAGAAGLVIGTALKMAQPVARSPVAVVFLLAAFAASGLLRWPLAPVLCVLAPLSVLAHWRAA